MFGLRLKMVLGLGGMVALLLITGGTGVYLLMHYSGTVDRIFRENYNSVVYGQVMKDAVDQMLDSARPDSSTPVTVADQALARFDDNLRRETDNITVPGEREGVTTLTSNWEAFRTAFQGLRQEGLPEDDRRSRYRTIVAPTGQKVKDAAQRIIDLNLENILSEDGEIRHDAAQSRNLMIIIVCIGVGMAVVFNAFFARSLLGPLRTLTRSAREIEHGNLDLVVAVSTTDEIGQLGEAFNAMAGRLRRTRLSDRQKIIRAEHTTQIALDSLPDAVATITSDGAVDLANQTAQRLFHLRPGVRLEALDNLRLLECWRQAVTGGPPVLAHGYETAIQVFDDGERFFLPHALPIKESDGQSIGVTLVLADITGLRRLDEMKSNLLAVVSHELRTPLTSLRMATHLLLDEKLGSLTTKQLELAVTARDDANRLHTIVEGLLNISRLESGRALLDLQPVDPQVLVDEAITAVGPAYRDAGIVLDISIPGDLPQVHADRVRIAHVFANLLGNALKYTPHGGKVHVTAYRRDETVVFQVADNGCGIPVQHRMSIFERFYRIPGQAIVGAGLGLAIAKEIVQAHGGVLWLAEQNTPGSTFCFSLPVAT
jgi:NtrC-family two-component system sensor histidine kinase KinB